MGVKASWPLAVREDLNCQGEFLREGKRLWFGKSAWHVTSEQHPRVCWLQVMVPVCPANLGAVDIKTSGQEELRIF